MKFSSEMNKDWYQEGSVLKTNSLSNEIIEPGKSKTVKLTLTKTMTEDNTGTVTNTAEIGEALNEENITDINSTPGNNIQGENDMSSADLIISIKTGGTVIYASLIGIIIAMFIVGVFFVTREDTKLDELEKEILKGL